MAIYLDGNKVSQFENAVFILLRGHIANGECPSYVVAEDSAIAKNSDFCTKVVAVYEDERDAREAAEELNKSLSANDVHYKYTLATGLDENINSIIGDGNVIVVYEDRSEDIDDLNRRGFEFWCIYPETPAFKTDNPVIQSLIGRKDDVAVGYAVSVPYYTSSYANVKKLVA